MNEPNFVVCQFRIGAQNFIAYVCFVCSYVYALSVFVLVCSFLQYLLINEAVGANITSAFFFLQFHNFCCIQMFTPIQAPSMWKYLRKKSDQYCFYSLVKIYVMKLRVSSTLNTYQQLVDLHINNVTALISPILAINSRKFT